MFWFHYVPFALLGLFTIIELGLSGNWEARDGPFGARAGFMVFVSVWSFLSLLAHFTFPYAIAGAWAIFTALLWLIASSVLAAADCTNYGVFRLCVGDSSHWNAMIAFGFLAMFATLALLPCFWWHVVRQNHAGWRDGIYGKSYYWKARA